MSFWFSLLNDVSVSFFGSVLSASFCDALGTHKNRRIFVFGMILLFLLRYATPVVRQLSGCSGVHAFCVLRCISSIFTVQFCKGTHAESV